MREQREITILIQCRDLPGVRFGERTAVRLGIQKGPEVVDDVPAEGDRVTLQATLRIGGRKTGEPNFLGPYAFGTPEDRFLYLCWGDRIAGRWDLIGRAKIPLTHLGWGRLNQAWGVGEPIRLSVAMTDSRGGPACGTVETD
jgi:hypothetical protein